MYVYIHVYTQAYLSGRSHALEWPEDFPSTVRVLLCQWKVCTSRALPWEVPSRTFRSSAKEVPTSN